MFGRKARTEKEVAIQQMEQIQQYQAVFRSAAGKVVLRHLMTKHGVLKSTFATDPYQTAYNEGQRAVVLEIMKTLKIDIKELQSKIDGGEFNE